MSTPEKEKKDDTENTPSAKTRTAQELGEIIMMLLGITEKDFESTSPLTPGRELLTIIKKLLTNARKIPMGVKNIDDETLVIKKGQIIRLPQSNKRDVIPKPFMYWCATCNEFKTTSEENPDKCHFCGSPYWSGGPASMKDVRKLLTRKQRKSRQPDNTT